MQLETEHRRVWVGLGTPRRHWRPLAARSAIRQGLITVAPETMMRLNGMTITFEQLQVNGNVTVTGFPKGKNMEATEIERKFSLPSPFRTSF